MQNIGKILTLTFNLGKLHFTINYLTIINTWLVIGILLTLTMVFRRGLSLFPSKKQAFIEALVGWFDNVLEESLGPAGRRYLGFILTIFLFVILSNWLALIPRFKAPTSDLNTCLGLGLAVFLVAHFSAIRKKGIKKYLVGYFKPFWFLFPSNVISEFSKVLSHSFRLFGNIFAGGIVISVIPVILVDLLKALGIPLGILGMPFINIFFVIFIGAVQAFVFTMLAVAYISVLQQD
jgi:F-type H+-transporting ATPase subunit a